MHLPDEVGVVFDYVVGVIADVGFSRGKNDGICRPVDPGGGPGLSEVVLGAITQRTSRGGGGA